MKYIILLLFFLIQFTGSRAQAVLQFQDSDKWSSLGKYTLYFRDNSNLDIHHVLQKDLNGAFQPLNKSVPNFGSTSDAVWLKFSLEKNIDQTLYLHIGSAFIDSIELYAIDGDKITELQQSGDNYAFSKRAVKVTTFLFPLKMPVGKPQTYLLRVKTMQPFFFPIRVGTLKVFMEDTHKLDFIQGIYLGFMLLIFFYNLFLYFSTRERIYLFYVAYVASITWFMSTVFQYVFEFLWPNAPIINEYAVASSAITILTATLFTREILHTKKQAPQLHRLSWIFIGFSTVDFLLVFTPFKIQALVLAQIGIMLMAIYFLIAGVFIFRKGYHPAKYYLQAWIFLILGFIAAILETIGMLPVMYYINSMQIGSAIEVALLSLALADKINIYKKEREDAQIVALKLAKEKTEWMEKQNLQLELKVSQRTIELSESLTILKEAQAQLIQSEKMTSFGELTAGIAHEIQNPLNFVNNFSELNTEMLQELKTDMQKAPADRDENLQQELLNDLFANSEKINHHGRRADGIVKTMLQHSRGNTGTKEPTDINSLCDEYLKLAYHGLRAKDKTFNVRLETDFDESIGELNIVPQDLGRVILNLINNAFYACAAKRRLQMDLKQNPVLPESSTQEYLPIVHVKTTKMPFREGKSSCVQILVKDNGLGIPQKIKDKIFQPFFTTKPTGHGTGLGLSLAYDIITNGHGGELLMESKEGEGTSFTISLPYIIST